MKQRVCDATVEVLRETGNPAVMWGDEGLLHLIAERMCWKHECTKTSDRVLNALSKTPGDLIPKYTRTGSGRSVRIFRLLAEILWVIGIVDAYGHVESVIIRYDDPDLSVPHEELFGPLGNRWRASSIDDVTWYKEVTDEEELRVKDHLENIFGL